MLIEPLLPPWPERSPGPLLGVDRLCLQGILYVLHNDIAWQLLPLESRFGSGQTCWRRLERWQQAGVFNRRKAGSKHHLICDGRGTPLKVTTAANVNDVTQTLDLVDGIPPVSGRPGRPRRRPDSLLGDKGYDSNRHREVLRKRRVLPVVSRKGAPNIKGLGKIRYVVELLRPIGLAASSAGGD
ncbi:transposase [Streptomyces sp. NPDC048481]|uniref:transposase n=1 Tax=Streptomyces sp. NPDC048481 TaxID=3365557 RepID=UPI00371924E9